MLEVEKKKEEILLNDISRENKKGKDIIVTKYEEITEYNNGILTIKRNPIKINITKKVNETKKLIKNYTAEEKLNEINKIFTN